MTASYDGAGNLIESHTYDANGFGISSTGPGDEIANIQYGLAGSTAAETITRVTHKTGATTDVALRPVGNAWRTVRVTGGCSDCSARRPMSAMTATHYPRAGSGRYVTLQTYGEQSTRDSVSRAGRLRSETDPQRCRLDPTARHRCAIATDASRMIS
jgi:hypothetical protein